MDEIIQYVKDFPVPYWGLVIYILCFLAVYHIVEKRSSNDDDHIK